MKQLLDAFESKAPEIVFEWQDAETDARGWVVINSLRGGAAGGGTRMRKGLDKAEVLALAKTMEVKFACCGPQIGGGKSGINFDPEDPRRDGVVKRWYRAVAPLLKNYYGTGGDMNIDEVRDVIPVTRSLGVRHPQEGIVVGHFDYNREDSEKAIQNLKIGVELPVRDGYLTPEPDNRYVVADLITGYGVSESVKHFYDVYGGSIEGKRVIVQGWGNVGAAAAFYQAQAGAKIVGIIDRVGGLIKEDGFTFEEIKALFIAKEGNKLVADDIMPFDEVNAKIWDVKADIMLPCAASRLLTRNQLERMKASGVEVISAGANVPFNDTEIFMGPIAVYADEHFAVIPDFIANCGMARTFAYCMDVQSELTDKAFFADVSGVIKQSLEEVHAESSARTGITGTSLEMVLQKLVPQTEQAAAAS